MDKLKIDTLSRKDFVDALSIMFSYQYISHEIEVVITPKKVFFHSKSNNDADGKIEVTCKNDNFYSVMNFNVNRNFLAFLSRCQGDSFSIKVETFTIYVICDNSRIIVSNSGSVSPWPKLVKKDVINKFTTKRECDTFISNIRDAVYYVDKTIFADFCSTINFLYRDFKLHIVSTNRAMLFHSTINLSEDIAANFSLFFRCLVPLTLIKNASSIELFKTDQEYLGIISITKNLKVCYYSPVAKTKFPPVDRQLNAHKNPLILRADRKEWLKALKKIDIADRSRVGIYFTEGRIDMIAESISVTLKNTVIKEALLEDKLEFYVGYSNFVDTSYLKTIVSNIKNHYFDFFIETGEQTPLKIYDTNRTYLLMPLKPEEEEVDEDYIPF